MTERVFLQFTHDVMLLVPAGTGVTYEHQHGGGACDHSEVEGFLVPCGPREYVSTSPEFTLFNDMRDGRADVNRVVLEIVGITPPDFARLEIGYAAMETDADGSWSSRHEGMLPVLWNGRECWLIWNNSD